jgi:hypothetical protein
VEINVNCSGSAKEFIGKVKDFFENEVADSINTVKNSFFTLDCPYREDSCEPEKCDCAKYKAYKAANEPGMIEKKLEENGFDPEQETWPLIMAMQKSFASRLHKMEDLTKEETDHWIDRYLVCIDDEIRELREHLNIYNDNHVKNNKEELKKEVIDILHFVMDVFLSGNANAEDIKQAYLQTYAPTVKDTTDFITFAYINQKAYPYNFGHLTNPDDYILKLSCKLSDACATVRQQISWKHWKKPSATIDQEKLLVSFAGLFKALVDLFIFTMSVDEIRDIYVKKNVENILRQELGY